MAGGGRDNRPVLVVEVEVAATGEVGEGTTAARDARREREERESVEGVRVDQLELRPIEPDAHGHETSLGVERGGRALAAEERRGALHRVAERTGLRVAVGHVGVVVQVAAAVRRHERVLRRGGPAYRVRLGGRADEHRQRGGIGAFGDGNGAQSRRSSGACGGERKRQRPYPLSEPPAHARRRNIANPDRHPRQVSRQSRAIGASRHDTRMPGRYAARRTEGIAIARYDRTCPNCCWQRL